MCLRKRKLTYKKIKHFNDTIDHNDRLQDELLQLSKNFQNVSEKEYRKRLLEIFNKSGIRISASELDSLITSRLKIEQTAKEQEKGEN